jgi:hypothetical protein
MPLSIQIRFHDKKGLNLVRIFKYKFYSIILIEQNKKDCEVG